MGELILSDLNHFFYPFFSLTSIVTIHMVNDVLDNLAANYANNVLEWVKYINTKSDEFQALAKLIAYSTTYMEDEVAYKILVELRHKTDNPIRIECYVLINDRFSDALRRLCVGEEKKYWEYIEKYRFALDVSNPLIFAVQWIWIMGRIGPDNTRYEYYTKIAEIISQQLYTISNSFEKNDIVQFKEGFLRNAYMIFFNASSDLEEKYYCYPAKSVLCPVIRDLIKGQNGLSSTQLDIVRSQVNIFDEAIDFFVCNLLFIESSLQNHFRARKELEMLYSSFNDETSVVEIDFYLSALFLSEYIVNPLDRQFYLEHFRQAVGDFETIMFTSPANNRAASCRRFSDLVDIEFEDGFNALTNYTYTAPSINYIGGQKNCQPVEEYLEEYWKLLKTLERTGSYKEIVRLMQAINQMIVNWPGEGFEALHRFALVKHPIITQAIVRVLSQNYLRYPQITKSFLYDIKPELDSTELSAILGSTDSHIQYRTLEQLQWARMIYFLRNYIDPNIVQKVLSVFLSTDTLEAALSKIMSLVIYPCNDEI